MHCLILLLHRLLFIFLFVLYLFIALLLSGVSFILGVVKMISAIFGLPGSGKSLLLSFISFKAVQGKSINFHGLYLSTAKYARVYTNFPCEGAYKLDFDTLGHCE